MRAQGVHGLVDVFLRNAGHVALGGKTAIFRHFEFRHGFNGGGKLERLAFRELDILDVRVPDDFEFFVLDTLAIGFGDQLAFDLIGDVLLVALDNHVARGFAGPETGEGSLTLEIFGDGFESGVDGGGIHFEPNQFLAGC